MNRYGTNLPPSCHHPHRIATRFSSRSNALSLHAGPHSINIAALARGEPGGQCHALPCPKRTDNVRTGKRSPNDDRAPRTHLERPGDGERPVSGTGPGQGRSPLHQRVPALVPNEQQCFSRYPDPGLCPASSRRECYAPLHRPNQ